VDRRHRTPRWCWVLDVTCATESTRFLSTLNISCHAATARPLRWRSPSKVSRSLIPLPPHCIRTNWTNSVFGKRSHRTHSSHAHTLPISPPSRQPSLERPSSTWRSSLASSFAIRPSQRSQHRSTRCWGAGRTIPAQCQTHCPTNSSIEKCWDGQTSADGESVHQMADALPNELLYRARRGGRRDAGGWPRLGQHQPVFIHVSRPRLLGHPRLLDRPGHLAHPRRASVQRVRLPATAAHTTPAGPDRHATALA
jgi:hypothetical protein